MTPPDSFENSHLQRLLLFVYLLPILGLLPALWRLYRPSGNPQQQTVSRLAVTLGLLWLGGTLLMTTGANGSEFLRLPFLLVSSLWTSGYFLISLGLMIRIWQRRPPWLPGVSDLGDRLFKKSTPR
ncbi:hypothetical protein DO97_15815 [Neosynechococcus sphagnicola sy1]|uniref:Uncharacterized protein n=1 Tax=Neosynechococcus sphagnicola sy1 TaxID=1497020 RepID=A0A098TI03_9CYAN|nr:hypothetical protein [Neosynechococcus sphagnicola]KGF71744.1 hypothetical protein DO97_15815 [Neosynechococcus sphagnicola sy1]